MDDELNPQSLEEPIVLDVDLGEAPLVGEAAVVAPKTDGLALRRRRQLRWTVIIACLSCSFFLYEMLSSDRANDLPEVPRVAATSKREEVPRSATNEVADIETPLNKLPSLLEQAKTHWADEDFNSVVETCSQILDIDPNNERALFVRSSALARLGDWLKSIQDHLRLEKNRSTLSQKPSPEIGIAFIESAKIGIAEGYDAMDRGDLITAKRRFDQSVALCDSARVIAPTNLESTFLKDRAAVWSRRCVAASLDMSGQIAGGLKCRIWKDSTGTHSFEARLVKEDVKVRLEGIDGSQIGIDFGKLSLADQKWIEVQRRLISSFSEQTTATQGIRQ